MLSATSSYGIGVFAFIFAQDMTTLAAFAGFCLVCVRIMGDLPKAIGAWQTLLRCKTHDSTDDSTK